MSNHLDILKIDTCVLIEHASNLLASASEIQSLQTSKEFSSTLKHLSRIQSSFRAIDCPNVTDSAEWVLRYVSPLLSDDCLKLKSLIDANTASRSDAPARSRAVVNSSGAFPESLSTAFPFINPELQDEFLLIHQTITENLLSTPINPHEEMISVSADLLSDLIAGYSKELAERQGLLSSGSVSDTPTKVWKPIPIDRFCHPEGDAANQIDLI